MNIPLSKLNIMCLCRPASSKTNLSFSLRTIPISMIPLKARTHSMPQQWLYSNYQTTNTTHPMYIWRKTPEQRHWKLDHILLTQLLTCHVPAGSKPMCPTYETVSTKPSHVVTCAAIRDDVVWLVGHSLTRTGTEKQNYPHGQHTTNLWDHPSNS